jgi:hypothetical protein
MDNDETATFDEGMSYLVAFPRQFSAPAAESPGAHDHAQWACEQLERGHLLFFPRLPFEVPQNDQVFLLTLQQTGARYADNIEYRPQTRRVSGFSGGRGDAREKLGNILGKYSDRSARFLADLLTPYTRGVRRDFANYQALQEGGHPAGAAARNNPLHTDVLPTRPTNGDRILRVFANINPAQPCVWLTSRTFSALAPRWAAPAGLDQCVRSPRTSFSRQLRRAGNALGLPVFDRPPYDQFMLRFRDYLNGNEELQRDSPKNRVEFPAGSAWMVFTDMVSHAVLSGQFVLEQTFIVSRKVLVRPEFAPCHVLEKMCGRPVTDE